MFYLFSLELIANETKKEKRGETNKMKNKNVVYQFGVGQDFQQCNESDAVLQIFDQVVHSKRWNSLRKINKKKKFFIKTWHK